jgi:Ca-activated chloride channel family protein
MNITTRMDHAAVPIGAPNVVHVLIAITAPDQTTGKPRPPLNLAAVIDRSGSMGGKKIESAKESLRLLLDQLAPVDRFSLVAFDNEVLPLVEGVLAKDKTEIREVIDRIQTGGSTNLSGGWVKGIELADRKAKPDQVNAVLLLTDGQANQGIVDRAQLIAIGENIHKEKAIRTTCLGLGADFNEDLLKDIATNAGGRFYYIETPDQAPEVFKEELGGLLAVTAQNVELELTATDGVSDIAHLTGYKWKNDNKACRILLGDFHAQQVKHVLLALQLPALTDVTDMHLATMRLTYAELKDGAVDIKSQKRDLVIRVVKTVDPQETADPEVLLHIALQRAATARKEAVEQIDKGDINAATKVLENRRDQILRMAEKTSEPARVQSEAEELTRRATELRETHDVGESRKFMVAEGVSMSQVQFCATESARYRRSQNQQSRRKTGNKA